VIREFVDVESAKNPGRKEFGNLRRMLETHPDCRVVLVEKTDRLYRNRTDSLLFEELIENRGVEVHLVKEGRVISKNSRSQDKFMHDIHVAVAKNYVENLKEEVKKGMREKAEQGVYPGRAPFGYRNNSATRTVEVDPLKAPVLRRIFELYATGDYSLVSLRRTALAETGVSICRAYLETILKNRFYRGDFMWQGIEYKGTHEPLIAADLFERVQRVFAGYNKPKYRKHSFAFAGLLTCAHDGCTVTAELHKQKYVYYRCSYGRGKCALPYMPEPEVSNKLGEVLKDIYVPEPNCARDCRFDCFRPEPCGGGAPGAPGWHSTAIGSASNPYGSDVRGQVGRQDRGRILVAEDDGMANARASPGECRGCAKHSALRESAAHRAANFRTRKQGTFSVPYAQSQGTGPTSENRAFELRHGWRKYHTHIQEALRLDLSQGQE
jgi:DNA invertase Pin-like site-specific DNA recombinase